MDDLTLIVCGSVREGSETIQTGTIRHLDRDLETLSAAECKEQIRSVATEFLAFSRTSDVPDVGKWGEAGHPFQSHANLNILLVLSESQPDEVAAWQTLPTRVVALRQNWAKAAQAIILRSSFIKQQSIQDVPITLWDLMIRAAQAPGHIQTCQASGDHVRPQPVRPGLAPSVPGLKNSWLKAHLQSANPEDLVSKATSRPDAIALQAGLWQMHDYLHESHELSQSIEGEGRNAAGDYWHAIMHRREPDYGNSKYWFRHVGHHPIFEPLRTAVETLLTKSDRPAYQLARKKLLSKSQWDPMAFVDLCQECAKGNDPELTRIAEEIQWREMCLLLEQTYRDATA